MNKDLIFTHCVYSPIILAAYFLYIFDFLITWKQNHSLFKNWEMNCYSFSACNPPSHLWVGLL